MTKQHSTRDCQAKDPSTCPYHGTEHKINEAVKAGDLNSVVKLLKEEASKPSGIFLISDRKGRHLGEVNAKTQEEAIKLWCKKPANKIFTFLEKGEILREGDLFAWEHKNVVLSDFIDET